MALPTCNTCHAAIIDGDVRLKVRVVLDSPPNQPPMDGATEEYALEVCRGCHEELYGWMFRPLPNVETCDCCPRCSTRPCDGARADGLCDQNCTCSDVKATSLRSC